MALSDSELWERIKRLEGETVYTLKRRNPIKILRIPETERLSRIRLRSNRWTFLIEWQ